MMKTTIPPLSWYSAPAETKSLLLAATQTWEEASVSESYMQQALAQPDPPLDVLITAYRFFFYRQKYALALQMAERAMKQIGEAEQLPEAWDDLRPILNAHQEEPSVRLYLNAYMASGFVRARLGDLETAQVIAARVRELDHRKEFGAAVLWDILTHANSEDGAESNEP